MTLVILTGMKSEAALVDPNKYPVLSGVARDYLDALIPSNCTAIISFGVGGGLSPDLKVGDVVISKYLVASDSIYVPDFEWVRRLTAKLPTAHVCRTFSDRNVWVTDPVRRAEFYKRTGASMCDTESASAAMVARKRKIPFAILRTISDQSDQTVINDPAEVSDDGSPNILVDIKDFFHDPKDMISEALGFSKAIEALKAAYQAVGDDFCF